MCLFCCASGHDRIIYTIRRLPNYTPLQQHTGKTEEAEEEENEDKDWMSISSDEGGKTKVIHVHEKCTSQKGKSKAKVKNTMSPEDLKAVRQENGKTARLCRKLQGWLEPLVKSCNKASKSRFASNDFKDEIKGAKDILKQCKKVQDNHKDKVPKTLVFEHTEEVVKDLKKSLEKHLKCVESMDNMMNGGLDSSQIARIADAAKQSQQGGGEDVD